ncbi:MAG: hypothetical protein OEV64_00690 [Desulfobulbaceae bacterium]|nr:hypothetical protein [Desulfobulbaceae bacterium]
MSWYRYPRYVSVAEIKEKAMKKIAQLIKKNPDINPVVTNGNDLAKTWWGQSWNTNLESYADFSNRIGRGRSYVRHGAVLDLQITEGRVEALVQGSSLKPYEVLVTIKKLSRETTEVIKSGCRGKLSSLQDLLGGTFPKELNELFLARGTGLFPIPKEIYFSCNCKDMAVMCKHVAATLYGIGVRFDEDPLLFFKLRSIEVGELVAQAVRERTGDLLSKIEVKSDKIIKGGDLSDLFGIELDDPFSELNPQKMRKSEGSSETTAECDKNDNGAKSTPDNKTKSTRQAGTKKETNTRGNNKGRYELPENLRKAIDARIKARAQSKETGAQKVQAGEKKKKKDEVRLPGNLRKAIETRQKTMEQAKESVEPLTPKVEEGDRKRAALVVSEDVEQSTPQKKKKDWIHSERVLRALKEREAMPEQEEADTKKLTIKKGSSPSITNSTPLNNATKPPADVTAIIEQWKQTLRE